VRLEDVVGATVKVRCVGGRKQRSWCRLVGVEGGECLVLPNGHKRVERVPRERVSVWATGVAIARARGVIS
jgi:hypothetical protein